MLQENKYYIFVDKNKTNIEFKKFINENDFIKPNNTIFINSSYYIYDLEPNIKIFFYCTNKEFEKFYKTVNFKINIKNVPFIMEIYKESISDISCDGFTIEDAKKIKKFLLP